MKLEKPATSAPPVQSYGPGGIRVSGVWREAPLILRQGEIQDWTPPEPEAMTAAGFAFALEAPEPPELVVFGSGGTLRRPPKAVRQAFLEARIGLETAPTDAACRLYNVLLGEGRDVTLALLPMSDPDA